MANKSDVNIKLKPSVSEEMYTTTYSMRSADSKSEKLIDPRATFEVFRNNTTAVEVIVKEIPTKLKKVINQRNTEPSQRLYGKQTDRNDVKYERMLDEIEQLKHEVNTANRRYFTAKRDIRSIVFQLKKQLEILCQREIDEQTKNLTLQLENEKLQTILDLQLGIINRLKKELNNMKRTLKFVVKGISAAPQVQSSGVCGSDIEYDDFEKGLKKENQVKFAANFDGLLAGIGHTFDSTLPSFDKLAL